MEGAAVSAPLYFLCSRTQVTWCNCKCLFISHTHTHVLVCTARVIPVYSGSSDLLSVVLEETGGLGVDVIVDSGGRRWLSGIMTAISNSIYQHWNCTLCLDEVRLQEEESEETKLLPHKHDVISVLGVGGHWVTSHKDLQVSRSNIKAASIFHQDGFLYFHSWILQILDYCS